MVGTMIGGRYKLIEAIGEGGMGSVWLAEQREPVRRKVAIKLVKAGMDSKQVLARFEAERQALALMDHPNIAKVFDGGMTDQGRPFFVMEYVKGVPLTEYCDQARLSLKERLNLFMPVCQAVQHAHQKGIIHRDLKPSNILICLYDGKPVPKVIDFGLAKAMYQALTDQSLHTAHGVMVGTPLYMSPEQAEHNNLDVDTRTDIYSLGVILYELLTGSTPLERQQLKEAAFNEILRLIKEVEPPKPSTRLSSSLSLPSIAAQRSIDPKQLSRMLIGDLDWIVMKALDKERGRRYETANGLARDVERYLHDEAVEACPPSATYRLKKFVRRNRLQVIAAGLVLVVLVGGITGTSIGLFEARKQRDRAELALQAEARQRKIAEQAEDDTLINFEASTDDAIAQLIGSKDELGEQEKTYLKNTIERWKKFADRVGDDQRSRAIRGVGHFRVARLWEQFGRNDEAIVEFQVARELYQNLAIQFPTVPEHRQGLANIRNNLGLLLYYLVKNDEASAEFQAACDIQTELVEQFPAVSEYQYGLANTHNSLGVLFADLRNYQEAKDEYQVAYELRKKLVDKFPTVSEYQDGLADTCGNQGNLCRDLGKDEEARAKYHFAYEIQVKLVEQFPVVVEYQEDLATLHGNLGVQLYRLGKNEAARLEYQSAIDALMKLVKQFPTVPKYQSSLARDHLNLASVHRALGDPDEARAEVQAAIDIQVKLVEP